MSESVAAGRALPPRPAAATATASLDPRRKLQLALAVVWLLDGILQYQPPMFTTAFSRMLGDSARGNPAVVAGPITWSAGFVGHHLAVTNAVFGAIQLALGLGIAWRPAVRPALAASVAWALGVWWLGEGLGGMLVGTASLGDGAPGAVILYAVLAVLLWPAGNAGNAGKDAPFVAARAVGRRPAELLWLTVWGSLAVVAVLPASRAPRALSGMTGDMSSGEPNRLGTALAPHGLPASVILAVALAIVAAGIFLPAGPRKAVIVAAILLAAALWLAQGLGGLLTGAATDPGSAPLLALLALAYWPRSPARWPRSLARWPRSLA